MRLFHQIYVNGESVEHWPKNLETVPVLIIPGLFGSTGNWRGFAKKMSLDVPVIVIDQRNHGQSPHAQQNAYEDLVGDVLNLLDDLKLGKVSLCGHSMGGKTAMLFALTHPDRVANLIVLDIAPATYAHSHAPILRGLKHVDLAAAGSRSDVEKQLHSAIPDKSTRMFIMLSLMGKPGEFAWRLNVDALLTNLPLIGSFPTVTEKTYEPPCLFIKGANSDYIADEHRQSIFRLFPNADIKSVAEAGHWVHIDQPQRVMDEILSFLKKREKND